MVGQEGERVVGGGRTFLVLEPELAFVRKRRAVVLEERNKQLHVAVGNGTAHRLLEDERRRRGVGGKQGKRGAPLPELQRAAERRVSILPDGAQLHFGAVERAKDSEEVEVTGLSSPANRTLVVAVEAAGVGAAAEEHRDELRVAARRCELERVVHGCCLDGNVHVDPVVELSLGHGGVASSAGLEQRVVADEHDAATRLVAPLEPLDATGGAVEALHPL